MKPILVATDFSPAALNALNYAADMAKAINGEIYLLHVYQVPIGYPEVPVIINIQEMLNDVQLQIDRLKEDITKKTSGSIPIKTEVKEGSFYQQLKNVCNLVKPYAVVMGSQGTTAAERFLFGSHSVNAMKNLEWPLITVPQGVRFSSIKKIGFACDFDNVIDTTPVDEIKMLVNDFKAELHVLNTGRQSDFDPDTVFQSGMLQEMIGSLNPNYHFIASENIDEGIIDFIEKNNIDLLLVLPKRHSLLDKLVHKSHTKQLVLHSHVPVMALHQ